MLVCEKNDGTQYQRRFRILYIKKAFTGAWRDIYIIQE